MSLQRSRLELEALRLDARERRDLAMQLLWSLPRNDVVEIAQQLTQTLQKDIVAALPPEVSYLILSKLSIEDVLQCTAVSRTWAARCRDQALWAILCAQHTPPIVPARTTWTDIQLHRTLMSAHSPSTRDEADLYLDSEDEYDVLTNQGGMGGGGGIYEPPRPMPHSNFGFAGVRKSVWERSTAALLPSHAAPTAPSRGASVGPPKSRGNWPKHEEVIKSYLDSPDGIPQVNYRHLYLTHLRLKRRKRIPYILEPLSPSSADFDKSRLSTSSVSASPADSLRSTINPKKLDAVSSIQAGGLPGHSEIIYCLELVRRRMTIQVDTGNVDGPYDSLLTLSRLERGPAGSVPVEQSVSGRNWILSGSRDRTLRLWTLDRATPKVVKVFHDGHDGSVLSFFVTQLSGEEGEARLVAVSAGSDGRVCLWDIEKGDGTPEKRIDAHSDSVLCIRGDTQRLVTCSKDRTIRVFELPNLAQTLCIEVDANIDTGKASVNAVGLSKDHIVSGSGDKSLRIWDINTGEQIIRIDAHSRGIASLSFDLQTSHVQARHRGGTVIGAIATGSSDATVKVFNLVTYPYKRSETERLSFEEMLGEEDKDGIPSLDTSGESSFVLERRFSCWAPCLCPPGLARLEGKKCGRCLNSGHMELVRSVMLKHDTILSGSYDGSIRIWDRDTGRSLANLSNGNTGRVFSVAGDHQRVVSSGMDNKIMLWDFGLGLDTSFVEP